MSAPLVKSSGYGIFHLLKAILEAGNNKITPPTQIVILLSDNISLTRRGKKSHGKDHLLLQVLLTT